MQEEKEIRIKCFYIEEIQNIDNIQKIHVRRYMNLLRTQVNKGRLSLLMKVSAQKRKFKENHQNPSGKICIGKGLNLQVEAEGKEDSCKYTSHHIHESTEQGDLQISHAAEESLNAVGKCGKKVHQGNEMQIADTVFHYFSGICAAGAADEETHDKGCTEITEDAQQNRVCKFDQHAAFESSVNPFIFAGALVLRQKGGHGVPDVLLRGVGKVIYTVDDSECRNDSGSHGICNGLDHDLADLQTCLLKGTCDTEGNDFTEKGCIK